jgi:hypothetical protein
MVWDHRAEHKKDDRDEEHINRRQTAAKTNIFMCLYMRPHRSSSTARDTRRGATST